MAERTVPLDDLIGTAIPLEAVYAVGGRVRDEFRVAETTIVPKDLDYVVVGLDLEELRARLSAIGRVDVVGASFAVLKLTTAVGAADIALPRRERSTGIAHRDFSVESGPDVPLVDDLGRRDFRMNMIARRLSDGQIVDPHGGVADVVARRIDILAEAAFDEDPLRMLRAAQFAARFEFTLSERSRTAMSAVAPLVATVSAERIGEEILKLMLAVRPSLGIEILRETGVLAVLWPELVEGVGVDQNEWHAFDVYRHALATLDGTPPGDPTLRIAALLHDVGKPRTKDGPHFYRHEHVGADLAPAMLRRLRLPTETVEAVTHLIRQHMYVADPDFAPKALRRFIHRIGPAALPRLFALRAADIIGSGLPKRDERNELFEARVFAVLDEAPPFEVRDLAIGGGDVIDLLVAAGKAAPGHRGDPRVGTVLRALFERVLDDPAENTRPTLLAHAASAVEQLGS